MNTSSAAAVRRAGPDDVAVVGDVLAASFTDTSVGGWLLADRDARKRLLRRLFTSVAGLAAVHGVVHLRVDGAGAAVWLPVNGGVQEGADLLTDDRTGGTPERDFAEVLRDLDGAPDLVGDGEARLHALARLHRLAALLHSSALTRETTRLPVFLLAVGVDPDARREGVAQQLLAAHHPVLDERYAPSLAVAVDPVGQDLYTAAGYQPHHVEHAGDGVSLQWMVRHPS